MLHRWVVLDWKKVLEEEDIMRECVLFLLVDLGS